MMQAYLTHETNTYVVGGGIHIRRHCDPDQLWFSFMRGVTFTCDQPPTPPKKHHRKPVANNKKIQFSNRMYEYQEGVEQIPLPFFEFREISNKHLRRLEEARFAGWEKTSDDRPFTIVISMGTLQKVKDWCRENCEGHFHVSSGRAIFALGKDAMMVKMIFEKKR